MPRIDKSSRRVKDEAAPAAPDDTKPSTHSSPPPPPSPPHPSSATDATSAAPTLIANMAYQQQQQPLPAQQQSHHNAAAAAAAAAAAGPYYSSQQALPPPSRGYVPAGSSVYGHMPSQHDVQQHQGGYQGASSAHMSYATHPAHSYTTGLPIHPQYQHQQHQQVPGQQPSSSYGEHQYAGHVYQQPGAYHTSQDDIYHAHHGAMQQHHGGMSHLDGTNGHSGSAATAQGGPPGGSGSDTSVNAMPGNIRPKRRQVKNACINCQKACKKCDEGRPCTRCIKYGLVETCQDSMRKERKRGIKRGPYKRRNTNGSSAQPGNGSSSTVDSMQQQQQQGPPAPQPYHHSDVSNGGANSASGSYDSHYMAAPAYRPVQPQQSGSNGNGGPYTSSPSPSLFPRDQPRQQPNANDSRGAWAGPLNTDAPSRATYAPPVHLQPQSHSQQQQHEQEQQLQQQYSSTQSSPTYSAAQPAHDFRSVSAPGLSALTTSSPSGFLPPPAQQNGNHTTRMLPPSPLYGSFPLPSPSGGSRPNAPMFSPPALSAGSGSSNNNSGIGNYLSSYGTSGQQHGQLQRLHSDSTSSSGQFSSPRTPLSAAGDQLPGMNSNGAGMAGSYLKSPVSSSASYAQQGQGGPPSGHVVSSLGGGQKPFPLQMPQFPRARGEVKW